jgi:DNA-binding LacI/PurR family transcriptional regulator
MKDDMLDKLKGFAQELREHGYYVEVVNSDDDIIERWNVDIILDKSKEKSDDLYG